MTRAAPQHPPVVGPRPVPAASRRSLSRLRPALPWLGPLGVVVLAAVLRLWNLGSPRSLVFDETYYVKDAFSLLQFGYEGQWGESAGGEGADAAFATGDTSSLSSDAAFIAHPPLGKWIIALGVRVFAVDDPFGWRVSTAVVGVLAVALVCVLAFALFRSVALATLAGGLLAIDGLAIVMSRTALLDNSLMLVTLAGFGAVLLDRRQSARRLDAWVASRVDRGLRIDWGPSLWWRPWLVAAGVLFGLATAVKWSGLYFLAVFAVYTLVVDAVARRRAGVAFWASSVVFRQAPVSFVLTVPTAAVAYVSTWAGWLLSSDAYGRGWADDEDALGGAASDRPFAWLPNALESLWRYHVSMYNTNVGLETPHSYEANPLTWFLLVRPTAFFYAGSSEGEGGCAAPTCSEYITSIANPVLWWLLIVALGYLVYRLARYREWRVGLILTGVAAGYLPWLLYLDRTVFQFYTIVFLPYLVLGATLVVKLLVDGARDASGRIRWSSPPLVALGVALLLVVATSVFFWSAWSGISVSGTYQRWHYWLPTWR
ncbi:dolichyl-phosphate-mannose--protein mannosyltransferase [Marisediminicola sp. LYQ134]|uniref:dolichyl-phosphate-mannose--protein mannosyltransferase n=1 Tax=Marisediminicola sp. LYQ134 TaxID=3391061 RepID=UPI0039835079